jgi:hypothetical protein
MEVSTNAISVLPSARLFDQLALCGKKLLFGSWKSLVERSIAMNPELNLWCHVLQQAIWDVAGIKVKLPQKEIPRLRRSARAWFLSSDETPGSFLWICHTLSLEAAAVRKRVLTASPAALSLMVEDAPAASSENSAFDSTQEAEEEENKTAVGF